MKKPLLSLLSLLMLCACIVVEDFGHAWKQSKPDLCISKIAKNLYAEQFRRDPTDKDMDALARALKIDGNTYLLLKQDTNDKGGNLYRFTIVHGIFQRWRLSPVMREAFERDYPDAPVILARDTVTLKTLDKPQRALLKDIVSKPEYWEIEEQVLYNPLRDPKCVYDDRPPEKLEKR